jgi:hypothetical protein
VYGKHISIPSYSTEPLCIHLWRWILKMSKKSKRLTRAARTRPNSPLSAHQHQGKVLKSPFNALPVTPVSWDKDFWPDFVWPCFLISMYGQLSGLNVCCQVLDTLEAIAAPHLATIPEDERPLFDGRLTSFELVPEAARQQFLEDLEQKVIYKQAVPEEFVHFLGLYQSAPGRWLLEPWLRRDISIDWEQGQLEGGRVRLESVHGQSQVATDAKALAIRAYFKAGKIHLPSTGAEDFDLLPNYPDRLSDEELRIARPLIRATFGGIIGHQVAEPESGSRKWAQEFWRANWKLFPCLSESSVGQFGSESLEAAQERLLEQMQLLSERFLKAAQTVDPDLYNPDRYEVLTGIVQRSLGMANALVSTPVLWSVEFGMPILRGTIEALIVFRWLVLKADLALYSRFKDFGRGKLKLYKLHLEEHIDSLNDDEGIDLRAYAEYVDQIVNQDINEEFQDISLDSSFSGVSAHKMAQEAGLAKEYQLYFAPASGVAHGEWSTLDRYALQRCQNPLHAGHRIPRVVSSTTMFAGFVDELTNMNEELVNGYISAFDSP